MLKLFDNCSKLNFGRNNASVLGMTSSEGERFEFTSPVKIEGPVEQWMQRIEKEMRQTLFQLSKRGVFYYASNSRNKYRIGVWTETGCCCVQMDWRVSGDGVVIR